jgi:hypothetical protein
MRYGIEDVPGRAMTSRTLVPEDGDTRKYVDEWFDLKGWLTIFVEVNVILQVYTRPSAARSVSGTTNSRRLALSLCICPNQLARSAAPMVSQMWAGGQAVSSGAGVTLLDWLSVWWRAIQSRLIGAAAVGKDVKHKSRLDCVRDDELPAEAYN